MRSILVLLLLAAPATAGPGSWTATRYGADETEQGVPASATGNATQMYVVAHAVTTKVAALVMTDPISKNQKGSATAADVTWYEMRFTGDEEASNPKWSIETDIHGGGKARAETFVQGSAWLESVEIIDVTGDNVNRGVGQLAVTDSGNYTVTLALPPQFMMTLAKAAGSVGTDTYTVKKPVKTTGAGKACRIRVDTYAKAIGGATANAGLADASVVAKIRLDLVMQGSVTIDGKKVTDTLRIDTGGSGDETMSKTTPPTGGIESKPGETPTDKPTDEEREGEEEEEVEASDLPETEGSDAGEPSTGESGAATTGE